MDSSHSDSRPIFVQSPYGGWNRTQMIDSMANPLNNNEQEDLHSLSESQSQSQPPHRLQPSLKKPRLVVDDDVFNPALSFPPPPTTTSNNPWMIPTLKPPPVNNGTGNIFYKTRMCAKFKAGTCRNGELCNFAHGIEDLRQPPSNWQEIAGPPGQDRDRERQSSLAPGGNNNNWEDDDGKIISRMKLCKKFCYGGECPFGDRCNFVHEELSNIRGDWKLRESSAISIGTADMDPPPSLGNDIASNQVEVNRQGSIPVPIPMSNGGVVKTVYWKTRICSKFENTGQCNFGDKCHFAHGQAELSNYVGRVEGEAGNVVVSMSKQIVLPANETFAMKPTTQVTSDSSGLNEERRRKRCLLNWSDSKNINGIYGDWIDDLPVGKKCTKPGEK